MMNEKFKLNILFTSDIHGNLLSIKYSDNQTTKNGLVRLSSAIKEYRIKNSILIDNGDTIQGNPLMYFHQVNRDKYKNPVSEMFNTLNYDYFIPGNHDFNYGQDYLFDFIKSFSAKTLCQNIYKNDGLLFENGFDIKTFDNNFKVLIIGATTKYIPNWENPTNIIDTEFNDVVEEVKKVVSVNKNKVDLIICSYHGGLEKDLNSGDEFVEDTGENQGFKLFKEIPEIDILITGHQHREICLKIEDRIVVQPGSNASLLGLVKLEYNSNNEVVMNEPLLIKAADYKIDKSIENKISEIESANQIFLDQVIGEVVEGDLEIKDTLKARIKKHSIVSFINNIQLRASKAMISSTSLANTVSGFKKKITIRNVLSTYVFANTLVVVEIDGKALKSYLEKCAEYFEIVDNEITFNPRFSYPKLEHYNYDMLDGIDYVFNLRKPFGSRVESIKYLGKEICENDIFTLVLNNYRASGGGDFAMLKNLKIIKEIPFDVAELIIDYIRKERYLYIKPNHNLILLK